MSSSGAVLLCCSSGLCRIIWITLCCSIAGIYITLQQRGWQMLLVSEAGARSREAVKFHPLTDEGRQFWSSVVEMEVRPGIVQDCNKIKGDTAEDDVLPSDFRLELQTFQEILFQKIGTTKRPEGTSLMYTRETLVLWNILTKVPGVRTICETGFNTGEGTLLWLFANENTRVFSFDIGIHRYAIPMAAEIQKRFPGRHKITWGDSMETLPEFVRSHGNVSCDVILIDGGHTYAASKSDFENFAKIGFTGSLVILDNYPDYRMNWMKQLGRMWEGMKRERRLMEIFKCSYGWERNQGFSFGYLIK